MGFLENNGRLTLISGPCALESYESAVHVAATMGKITQKLGIDYYFKASIDKANRTGTGHFRGLGFREGLATLARIKQETGLRVVTDIHEPWQAKEVAEVADIVQIPAFLCRQTDLLQAAADTGKILNVKKAQFMSPEEIGKVGRKIVSMGNERVILCERGNAFGYNNLVVDMAGLVRLKKSGFPVAFDATHSVQISGGGQDSSNSGASEYVPCLAKAALATGAVDVLFMETHADPQSALCDGSCMVRLSEMEALLDMCLKIFNLQRG